MHYKCLSVFNKSFNKQSISWTNTDQFFVYNNERQFLMTKQMKMKKFAISLKKSLFLPHKCYSKKLPHIICMEDNKHDNQLKKLEQTNYDILIDGLINSTFKTERKNTFLHHNPYSSLNHYPSQHFLHKKDNKSNKYNNKKKTILKTIPYINYLVNNAINEHMKLSSNWNTLFTKVNDGLSWINNAQNTLNRGKQAYKIYRYDLQRLTRSISTDMRVSLYGQKFNKN